MNAVTETCWSLQSRVTAISSFRGVFGFPESFCLSSNSATSSIDNHESLVLVPVQNGKLCGIPTMFLRGTASTKKKKKATPLYFGL